MLMSEKDFRRKQVKGGYSVVLWLVLFVVGLIVLVYTNSEIKQGLESIGYMTLNIVGFVLTGFSLIKLIFVLEK